eukprot:1410693-Pleurochrysis_carterae.AAC.1
MASGWQTADTSAACRGCAATLRHRERAFAARRRCSARAEVARGAAADDNQARRGAGAGAEAKDLQHRQDVTMGEVKAYSP